MSQEIASVQEELDRTAAEFAEKVPSEIRATMDAAGEEVAEFVSRQSIVGVGDAAPGFTLPDATGDDVKFQALLGRGPVVLAFYRGGWCPYCNIELRALQAALPEFRRHGATLVAVSPEAPDQSLSTTEKNELAFPVLSDKGNEVARRYGLVFALPESLRPVYANFGVDLLAHNGDDSFELPVPATYVVDREGRVSYAFVNADYRQRAEPRDVVAALAGLEVR